jgi:hypothetical protein
VLAGDSELRLGIGLLMENVIVPDVPPPGAGLVTVMLVEPALTMSVAGTCAVICVPLTKVVVSAVPFQLITDAATKLAPVTVRVKAAPSAVVFEGERDEIVGTPLLTGNVQVPELPPPGDGLVTVTLTDAALVISLAGTCAVSCVLPTNVVVRATPFQLITAPLTKFVPLAVKVKAAPPAFALAGDNELIVGRGLLIGNVHAPEVPPPGAGFVTVMLAVPVLLMSLAGT